MPPVISTVPERYAFGTALVIVNGMVVVPSAGSPLFTHIISKKDGSYGGLHYDT
jgi:hypothetical protein